MHGRKRFFSMTNSDGNAMDDVTEARALRMLFQIMNSSCSIRFCIIHQSHLVHICLERLPV